MEPLAACNYADPGFVPRAAECDMIADMVRPHFCMSHERLMIFAFDARCRLVGVRDSGTGHRRRATLSPVMLRCVLALPYADKLLLAHNHPSGEASPSRCDIDLTRKTAALCALVGLRISDHLIFTDAGHFSFRAAGLV